MTDTNSLNAAIVRNIEDIEAAYTRATTEIEAALANQVFDIFETEAKLAGWESSNEPDLDAITAAPVEWRASSDELNSELYDLYLTFTFTGQSDLCWLSTFLGIADMRCGIFVGNDTLKHSNWKKILKSVGAVPVLASLSDAGFTVDLSKGEIAIYVLIDREVLAQGFGDGDISEAFEPMERALKAAIGCRGTLEHLLALVREAVG